MQLRDIETEKQRVTPCVLFGLLCIFWEAFASQGIS